MKKQLSALPVLLSIVLAGCGAGQDTEPAVPEITLSVTGQPFYGFKTGAETSSFTDDVSSVTTLFPVTSEVTSESSRTSLSEKISETPVSEPKTDPESETPHDTEPPPETEVFQVTEADIRISETEKAAEYESFTGILIDEDCSDFEAPPEHDLPCMLMDECRASGYGLDIQGDDGTWHFYMFDDKGKALAWDYLIQTDRMSELWVTVTGTLKDDIIYVETFEEK
ncbi:MAG: hypothetical protein J5864_05645 [Oscillospiraceae bacterium]|nr:hypothetical protein [Oscillospiraceae bacterium]